MVNTPQRYSIGERGVRRQEVLLEKRKSERRTRGPGRVYGFGL